MGKTDDQDTIRRHIAVTPRVCGGKPRIAGHRIRVLDVALWHERCGWTPDEIVAHFPQLTLADIHAALAYYWDHRETVLADIAAEEQLAEALRERTTSRLKAKLEGLSYRQNPVPPRRKRSSRSGQRAERPAL